MLSGARPAVGQSRRGISDVANANTDGIEFCRPGSDRGFCWSSTADALPDSDCEPLLEPASAGSADCAQLLQLGPAAGRIQQCRSAIAISGRLQPPSPL